MQSKSCRSPVLTSNNLTSGALTLDEEINAKYQRYVQMYDEEQSIQITMRIEGTMYIKGNASIKHGIQRTIHIPIE